MLNWMFQHDCLDTYCFWVSSMHVFYIFAFAPVQRNWACFTWKGALEIWLLLLLLLLFIRHWKKDTPTEHKMFLQSPRYLAKRSHNQWGSESQNWKRHQAIWRPPDFSEKTQTEVARPRHMTIWTDQDYPTGNSSRRKTKADNIKEWRQIKEWTGLEWNIILQKAENHESWGYLGSDLLEKHVLHPKLVNLFHHLTVEQVDVSLHSMPAREFPPQGFWTPQTPMLQRPPPLKKNPSLCLIS